MIAAGHLLAALQTAPLPALASSLVAAVMAAYLVVVLAIGAWASRGTRTAGDFYVAGKGLGIWTVSIASMAATISGFSFIGGPGLVYSLGLGAVHIVLPIAITSALAGWMLATRLRLLADARDVYTIPDALAARYRSPAAQGLSAVAIVVAVVGYLATNILALGFVIDGVFGVGLRTGIWLGALVTLVYSAAGGILAGVYTDLFQGTVMAAGSLLVFTFVLRVSGLVGGIAPAIGAVDPAFLSPWGKITPLAAMSFYFVFGIGAVGQPHVLHKFYMIRDPRRLKWYPLLMAAAMVVTQLLFIGVGLAVRALVAAGRLAPLARPDDATPTFLLHFTPLALAALVFAGAAAAIMSTVNSFLSVGAAALTHDLPRAFGSRVADELKWGRIATVGIAILAAVVAAESGTLVAFLGIFGWGLFASTIVPALAIGLNWSGATRVGAVASIGTGLGVTLSLETLAHFHVFTFPAGVTATALALVAAILVLFVVSWLTRHHPGNALDPDIRFIVEG